jgi:hypothetical protein
MLDDLRNETAELRVDGLGHGRGRAPLVQCSGATVVWEIRETG